jgi:hypothetical protein
MTDRPNQPGPNRPAASPLGLQPCYARLSAEHLRTLERSGYFLDARPPVRALIGLWIERDGAGLPLDNVPRSLRSALNTYRPGPVAHDPAFPADLFVKAAEVEDAPGLVFPVLYFEGRVKRPLPLPQPPSQPSPAPWSTSIAETAPAPRTRELWDASATTEPFDRAKLPSSPVRSCRIERILDGFPGSRGTYTVASLLATLSELDVANYYSDQIVRAARLGASPLTHIDLKRPGHHRGAELKIATESERIGYRVLIDDHAVIGYTGLVRIPLGHVPRFSKADDGGDPDFTNTLTGLAPGVSDACISALRLHHSYRAATAVPRKPNGKAHPIYRIRLVRAVADILVDLAERRQFVSMLWAAPTHENELDWFNELKAAAPSAVDVSAQGARRVFRIQLWPWLMHDIERSREHAYLRSIHMAYEPHVEFIHAAIAPRLNTAAPRP